MTFYGSFMRGVVLPNARVIGIDFWRNYETLSKTQWMPKKELERVQGKKLREMVSYSYENVPYYRSLFEEAGVRPHNIKGPADLPKIPVSTKKSLKECFPDKTASKAFPRDRLIRNSTSGSTGTPFAFYMDRQLVEMERAHLQRGYSWAGLKFGDRFMTLWGPHETGLKRTVFEALKRRRMLSAFEMNDKTMGSYLDEIKKYRPKLIESYVSAIYGLSKYVLKERGFFPGVGSIITSAETLSDAQRAAIKKAFGCPVYDRYGSREFGTIAHECEEHAGLHVSSESFVVECVSEDGDRVAPGEQGRIIVTCLENHAMPFIRYDTGDLGVPSDEECACGRGLPLVSEVSGRLIELVKTPSGKIISVHYLTLLFEDYSEYFINFQAVQKKNDLLEVFVEPTPRLNSKTEEEVLAKLERHAGEDMRVKLTRVDEIPLSAAGKRALLRSEVK